MISSDVLHHLLSEYGYWAVFLIVAVESIGIPLPGGEPWVAHIRFTRMGTGRIDVRTPLAEHVSVSVRGYGVEFDQLDDEELERLRDFLELLDNR